MRWGADGAVAAGARALDAAPAAAVVGAGGADAQAASTISEPASEDDRELAMADDAKIPSAHASSPSPRSLPLRRQIRRTPPADPSYAGGVSDRDKAELVKTPPGELLGEPPVVARLVVEIRSDGSRTIARGAMEDVVTGQRTSVEARGDSPIQLAIALARALTQLPRLGARSAIRGLLGKRRDR
jgi:hypothetical protein